MKLLVVGTGALGCLYSARLAFVGVDVTMLGTWQEAIDSINLRGVRVVGEEVQRVRAICNPEECPAVELALVVVKSWQSERAGKQLDACLSGGGVAFTFQNGLGNGEIIERELGLDGDRGGRWRVVSGVTTVGAVLSEPGVVRVAGEGQIWMERDPVSGRLDGCLCEAGFAVEVVEDIQPYVWGKLVVNSAINPLTAILGVANGELLNDALTMGIVEKIVQETASVANKIGIQLPYADPVEATKKVIVDTRMNISSMLRDIQRGAANEVEAINGEVVRLGKQYGVYVETNQIVLGVMREHKRLTVRELADMVR